LGDTIYQLTWRNSLVLQYDKDTLALLRSVSWPREGWGLTHNGRQLILSDGTAVLSFLNPETLAEERRITVHDAHREIEHLNELEYVAGAIYANVWRECRIAIIAPEDGRVTAWLDLAPLCTRAQKGSEDVLNGIAYDAERGTLFVTGKLWPMLFGIRVPSGR
jgi:glutamine cyclotransferase